MDDILKGCLDSLGENDPQILTDALQFLLRLCQNIVSSPNDIRYRRVRVSDSGVLDKLLPASGAMECLFEMGFVEDGEYFTLPKEASLSRLRQVQRGLHDVQSKLQSAQPPGTKNASRGAKPKIHQKKNFLERVVAESQQCLIYEDKQLQAKALWVMPIERLQIGAMRRMREIQRQMKSSSSSDNPTSLLEDRITVEDLLLAELLDWFKNEFFTWLDSPICSICGKACQYERVESSGDPRISRVEIHKCHDCGIEAEFPRYTDPGILLKTRRGRCGEWANAFTLLCRSLGFDARLVHDQTDHVWTEVWSIASSRWIHADPCENVMDRPLLYELGWKKELTYIIAYSRDEVQDVTWRYTRNQAAVMRRRKFCDERDLCSLICRLNDERQNSPGYSAARKRFVTKRRALELVELMPAPPGAKKPEDDAVNEYGGRTSGSLAWRSSRGETQEKIHESRVWRIPRESKHFELRYFSAKDEYVTIGNGDSILERKIGWNNGIKAVEGGIFRKIETDWKMAYLARSPDQTIGRITWSVEVANPEVAIKLVRIRATSATFHGATVKWKITGSHDVPQKDDIVLAIENCENFETDELDGVSRISLSAELVGGENQQAWQHAQLFRQSLNDQEDCSMSIIVETCEH